MTHGEALGLSPGERAIKLTQEQVAVIYRALDLAQKEIFAQRQRYVENNPLFEVNDVIYNKLLEQACVVDDLRVKLENVEIDL